MLKYIIDTILFSPSMPYSIGGTKEECIKNFCSLIKNIENEIFITPSSLGEIQTNVSSEVVFELRKYLREKFAPLYTTQVPAALFYYYINDISKRSKKLLEMSEGVILSSTSVGEKIGKIRIKSHEAMRTGTLDSGVDFELLLLARQESGILVTADGGLIKYAEQFGVECMHCDKFLNLLKENQ